MSVSIRLAEFDSSLCFNLNLDISSSKLTIGNL